MPGGAERPRRVPIVRHNQRHEGRSGIAPPASWPGGAERPRRVPIVRHNQRHEGRAGIAPPSWLPGRAVALGGLLALLLASALAWQVLAGYTPVGREYHLRVPGGWPVATAHDRLLARFLAQVPAAAPGSASADLFPHLAHRELLYEFPALGRSTWALVDVAGTTDRHPRDIKNAVDRLLQTGWGVVDAADGYILLAAGAGSPAIAPAFYDFARAPGARPQHPLSANFGAGLRLLGYDVVEDKKWRRTMLRYYWQALAALPPDTVITLQILAPDGAVANDSALRPLPALVWYPPAAWRVGETVVTTSDPWYLPATWASAVAVKAGGAVLAGADCATGSDCLPDGRVLLAPNDALASTLPSVTAGAQFQGPDWRVALAAATGPRQVAPGADVSLALAWSGWDGRSPGPAGRDYTVFVHLRGADGRTAANADAVPTWFVTRPTTRWPAAARPWTQPDLHTLRVPADLAPGRYQIVIGWYDWQSGIRLPVVAGEGNAGGDEFVLGDIQVDPAAARRPDLACLVAAEACASQ